MKTSIIIGLLIGCMAFPMIIIPVIGIGIVVWGLYVFFHDIIWLQMHNNQHTH